MKNLLLVLSMVTTVVSAGNLVSADDTRVALVQDYQMMFDRIGQKRIGADVRAIEAVKPPFVRLSKKEKKKQTIVTKDGTIVAVKPAYALQAIVNKRVRINGKWYKLHDKLDDFTLVSIGGNGVFLQNEKYKKRLTLRKKNEKITIK